MDKKKQLDEKLRRMEEDWKLKHMKEETKKAMRPVKAPEKKRAGSFFGEQKLKEKEPEEDIGTHFSVKEEKPGLLSKILGPELSSLITKKEKKEEEIEFVSKDATKFNIFGKKIIVKKQTLIVLSLNTLLVGSILAINFLMLSDSTTLFSTINILSLFIFAFPLILIRYNEYQRRKEIEEMFPVFLRDFVGTIRGGMTLPLSIKSLTRNDYKAMTPYVKKMAAQLDWGIPVERVLLGFARGTKSDLIMRIISSVIESHRFGGNLSDTFEALTETAVEIDRLREERKLYMNSQMITGYIIFFVFLAVMIGLQKFLVPGLADVSAGGIFGEETGAASNQSIAEEYEIIFRNLILLQGLFAGLSVGKMAEGSMVSGLKHSLFMMFVGFLVFTVAS